MTNRPRRLIIVGSRLRAYREYSLASLAREYELALVAPEPPTWQEPYLGAFRVADTANSEKLLPAVESLASGSARAGIVTWDEFSLVATAEVAEALELPHMAAAAARICRDKYATRTRLAAAGLPAIWHRLVQDVEAAVTAAHECGYPVVVKPRSLGGSLGVVLAHDAPSVREAYRVAVDAGLPGVEHSDGVLIEEFLDGPEISVDSAVVAGVPEMVFVARKRLGFDPCFEEVGHLVGPWQRETWANEVAGLVRAVHEAAGVDRGVTHAEVRLTPSGPRLVELNGRLGGDLIPYLGTLATGVDLSMAAAAIAFDERPDLTPAQQRWAEIRFVYPPHDGHLERVDLAGAAAVPGIMMAAPLAEQGQELLLPPRALTPRSAALIAVSDEQAGCARALDQAEDQVLTVIAAPASARLGAVVENAVTRRFLAPERTAPRMTVSGVKGVSWFRYGAGGGEGLNRPVFLSTVERQRLERDLGGLFDLLTVIPDRLFGGDRRQFARAVGMSATQAEIVMRGMRPRPAPLARADMYRETTGFKLMELNTGSSLGGWQMAEFAHAMMYDLEFRRFTERENLTYPDPLRAIADVMLAQCGHMDLPPRPLLALTDWPDGFAKTKCWMDFVVPAWMRMGFDTLVCHAGDFEHRDGAVYLHGRKVDIIYRMFLPGEMAEEQRSFDLVNPILDAVERGAVHLFAGLDCELYGNKGSLAMLSDERNRSAFTAAELDLIERILPWTRFLRDERVSRDGETVGLVSYALANRDHLVLKPTLLYGGVGVTPGWCVAEDEWAAQVHASVGGPFVLQERVRPTAERFVAESGGGFEEKVVAYGVMLVGGKYAGTLARATPDKQVGIVSMLRGAQIGCAFHVADDGDRAGARMAT
jgi:hypothetical protein